VHDWPSLTSAERRIAGIALGSVLATGLASRGGISGYSEADLRPALDAIEHLGVVQVPVSVLDQRLDQNSLIDELRARGVVIQARSVFLQGAALDAAAASRWGDHPDISRLRAFAAGSPEGMLAACVSYIQTRSWIDEVVIGVTSALELEDIVNQFEEAPLDIDFASLASQDETLIDPRKW
jgi:aryl-alcohol dehydrogenase-like predicted oxidoreductase